jgi:hypothetical protein
METLDYLIRTLTYKRSCLELENKKFKFIQIEHALNSARIESLNVALTEIYKLVAEMDHPNPSQNISDHEIVDNPNG